jgi:transketolase
VNTIRTLAMDAVQKANSGHPGTPMGAAPMAYALWTRHLRFSPDDPAWPARDRFVLSAGHASMLLYALLHLSGYDLSLEEIRNFRQWGSKTAGHPEYGHAPGIETTTGPLGQGFGNGVGMAIAARHFAARFNRPGHDVFGHRVYGIVSDGDLMEGVASEAASLAGHLKLGNLIYLYDDNQITIDGPTELAFTEDVDARFRAYGWRTLAVDDGNDLAAIDAALGTAQDETARPSLIRVRTVIGYGSPANAGKASAHGKALGEDDVRATKCYYGWPADEHFLVPPEVRARFAAAARAGEQARQEWLERLRAWRQAHPTLAEELDRRLAGRLPEGWDEELPRWKAGESLATRQASGKVLNALAARLPEIVSGAADLNESTFTELDGEAYQHRDPAGRNLAYGVREHAMGAIMNGLSLHGGIRPVGSTFLIFSDYLRPTIRLAALMRQPTVYVFTHDSIGLGEDGPTHQPVEQLPALRAIPNLVVLRPADANETRVAWQIAIERRDGPTALVLSRQKLSVLDRESLASAEGTRRGAYVLAEAGDGNPRLAIIATGSEVELALAARERLEAEGLPTRVVTMPSWELFAAQEEKYRDEVIPRDLAARLAVEAAAPLGWERWTGPAGAVLGVSTFGASAPYQVIYREYGLTPENIVARARQLPGVGG